MTSAVRDIHQCYWSSRTIPYLTIRSTIDSTHSYKAHYHSELSIGIIESGSTCLSMPKEQVVLNKGDIILIEPNVVHACNPIGGTPRSYNMLYIDNEWCCAVLSTLYGYKVTEFTCVPRLLSQSTEQCHLATQISTLLAHESKQGVLKVNSCLFDVLSRCCSPSKPQISKDMLAYKIRSRLLQDIEYSPSLDTLSKELGHTKETLIRNFKSHFGITPKSFLNNHRVEKAKLLLRCGMSIADVAIAVGFSDQSQLHRTFVNYTASTPRQYQQLTSIFDNNF